MLTGKAVPKLAMSFQTRRIRLGVAHHGAPSAWSAPTKDTTAPTQRTKPSKKRR